MTDIDLTELDPEDGDLIDKALVDLPRNEYGEIDQHELIEYIARRIDFDEEKARRQLATRMVANRRKPGATHADGQLSFDGFDPYDYEPDRLIVTDPDDEGRTAIVENSRAMPRVKSQEARRKNKKASEAAVQAQRATLESTGFNDWAIQQIKAGREERDLTFGQYVHEMGVRSDVATEVA